MAEVNPSKVSGSREACSSVQHPKVIIQHKVARHQGEAILMGRIAHDLRELVVAPIPVLHFREGDVLGRHCEIGISHLLELFLIVQLNNGAHLKTLHIHVRIRYVCYKEEDEEGLFTSNCFCLR